MPTLDWDLGEDFDFQDGNETVDLVRRDLAGATTSTETGVLALRFESEGAPADGGQGTQTLYQVSSFHLKAAGLTSRPRKGDRVVASDGEETFEITRVRTIVFGTRYAVDVIEV